MYELSRVDGYQYPDGAYVVELMPTKSGLVASSSNQTISLFDPYKLSRGPVQRIQTDHGNLTSTRVYKAEDSHVCSTGQNGTISLWDLRLDPSRAQALRIDMGNNQCGLLSLACSSETNSIAVGTELANHQASIILWDTRSASSPRVSYDEVHSDDVTELNFHPTDAGILLSGSTDGLINVCDTRIADEDEVVIQAINHGSVHRAGFLTNTEVFAASHDEKFAVYDMAENTGDGSAALRLDDVRDVLGCQYLANVFPKLNFAGAVLGVGSQDHEMFKLVQLTKGENGWVLHEDSVVELRGAHGHEVVRSFVFDDAHQLVFTAGEDGCVRTWHE